MKVIGRLLAPVAAGLMLAATVSAAAAPASQTEATRALATAFLQRYFIQHDTTAYQTFADPNFIQHDPQIGDGVAGIAAFLARIAQAPKGAGGPPKNITDMVIVDGDLFAVMHHSVTASDAGRVFVDIWRVRDGKIVEHWDVIQPIPARMPHGNGMACGNIETYAKALAWTDSIEHPTCGLPDPNASRAASIATYRAYVAEVGKGRIVEAINHFLSDDYRQHSPELADGKQGAIDYLRKEWGDQSAAKPVLEHMQILAEGDLVLCHYLLTYPATHRQSAQVDVFRVKNGQISEHWDIKEPVPAETVSGNPVA